MATWYVDPSGGSDTNDGRDPLGLSLVNATYDHTGGAGGERELTSTGAFSGYTFTAGDKIYLLNAVGGVADGLYEIASKVGANSILLVADAGLTADSTADVDSSNGPFLTIAQVQLSGAAYDTAILMGTATFSVTSVALSVIIVHKGATATGVVDGTQVTIQATSGSRLFTTSVHLLFENCVFTYTGTAPTEFFQATANITQMMTNCTANGNNAVASFMTETAAFSMSGSWLRSTLRNFTTSCYANNANRSVPSLIDSFVDNCTQYAGGDISSAGVTISGSTIKDTGLYPSNTGSWNCYRSTFDNCDLHIGDRIASQLFGYVIGCIFHNCPTYFLDWVGGNDSYIVTYGNNVYNPTSGKYNNEPEHHTDYNDTSTDPLFTDAANDNYEIANASPAKGAGVNGSDIGSWPHVEPAGGGGGGSRAVIL